MFDFFNKTANPLLRELAEKFRCKKGEECCMRVVGRGTLEKDPECIAAQLETSRQDTYISIEQRKARTMAKINFDQLSNDMRIPDYMQEGFEGYLLYGWEPGGFLYSVITNDLMGAFAKADSLNSQIVRNYVSFLFNIAPSASCGSEANYNDWVEYVRSITDEEREEIAKAINTRIAALQAMSA